MLQWADRVVPPPLGEVPLWLLDRLPSFDDARFDALAFFKVSKQLVQAWLPRQPDQRAPPLGRCPRRAADLMPHATFARVSNWVRRTVDDLACIKAYGELCQRDRPRVLVVSQGELHSWARGYVWDFRQGPSHCAQPLNYSAPLKYTLNVNFFAERLRQYPNQQLVSMVVEGVCYQADVELQGVFVPHLVSLPKGFASVEKELHRLKGLGWYEFYSDLPFWPIYANAQGATPRKLEQRWRRTTDGGRPRRETFDRDDLRVWLLNDASRLYHIPRHFLSDSRPEMLSYLASRRLPPTPQMLADMAWSHGSMWPLQRMPTIAMVMRDLTVLKRAAFLLDEPIYVFGDDVKHFFNHFPAAPEELWKSSVVFIDSSGVEELCPEESSLPPLFVSELRMGFGLHPNTNVAQQFAEALNYILREDVDAIEDSLFEKDTRPAARDWLTARQKLEARVGGHQRRLYSVHMYCDDNIIIVVGVQQAIRLLTVWRRLTNNAGLIMAIPEKRSLGTWCLWVGVLVFVSLGVVAVPREKIVRASEALGKVMREGLQFDAYRSVIGLLEHLRCVAQLPRRLMHGLYAPHGATGEGVDGPSAMVKPSTFMRLQLVHWLDILGQCVGCAVTEVLRHRDLATVLHGVFVASSDAATDSGPPGLGGYMHGHYWYLRVEPWHLQWLHISVLELLTAGFNAMIFYRFLPPRTRLLLQVDAAATVTTLATDSEHSLALIAAHHALLAAPTFQEASDCSEVQHIAGEANVAADAVSRALWETLRALAQQLRVQLHQTAFPLECRRVYNTVLRRAIQRGVRVRASGYAPPSPLLPVEALRFLTPAERMLGVTVSACEEGDAVSAKLLGRLLIDHEPNLEALPLPSTARALGSVLLSKLREGQELQQPSPRPSQAQSSATDRVQLRGSLLTLPPLTPPHVLGKRMPLSLAHDELLPEPTGARLKVLSKRRADVAEGARRRALPLVPVGASADQSSRILA